MIFHLGLKDKFLRNFKLRFLFLIILFNGITYAGNPPFLSFSSAWFDLIQRGDQAFEGRIELRLQDKFDIFKPFAGFMATVDGAYYTYSGILTDIDLTEHFVLTPSFAPGIYAKGDGKDLHFALEFRSQIEFSFRFNNSSRIGISLSHMSNASLGSENPGAESLALTYIFPL